MRIHYYRYVLALVLALTGAQQLLAQDAFYIYRNDGDFNGFFFDEIVRMGYSKTDLEGEEHDVYVVQEIETADSLYRIPLAAIDSIGFQQPEIRINPRVRVIDQCELKNYFTESHAWSEEVQMVFENLPDNLKPKVGDILINTDPGPDMPFGNYSEKTVSCVVDNVYFYEPNTTLAVGHFVTDPGEVFEQFITVEDVTVDKQGNVRRRLAGWHPEKVIQREQGSDEINLVDFDINVTREFNPTENTKIALDAKVGMKLKIRATYDIGWTRFYVKLSRELTTKVEPSLTLGLKGDFMQETENIVPLPEIIFPAACPIFGVNPYPTLFIHAWGEISAKLNFPKMEMGIGDEIVFNSANLFPISYDLYRIPPTDKGDKAPIDVSTGSLTFSGSVQTGIKVGCDVGTANWMQKIIKGNVGFYAYIGPQASAQLEFKTDWIEDQDMDFYEMMSRAQIDLSLLAVNIEAKATLGGFWQDQTEKSFLSKEWKYLCDTLYLVPQFEGQAVLCSYNPNDHHIVYLDMYPKPYHLLNFNELEFGIYERPKFEDYSFKDLILKRRVGKTTYSGFASSKYHYTLSTEDIESLKGGRTYQVFPLVTWLGKGPYPVRYYKHSFVCPCTMFMMKDKLKYNAYGGEESVEFTTNTDKNMIQVWPFDFENKYWIRGRVEAVNEQEGRYRAVFKALRNNELFDRKTDVSIILGSGEPLYGGGSNIDSYPLKVYQGLSDLSTFKIDKAEIHFKVEEGNHIGNSTGIGFQGEATATRSDNNTISVTGTQDSSDGDKKTHTTISFVLHRIVQTDPESGTENTIVNLTNGVIKTEVKQYYDNSSVVQRKDTWSATFEIDDIYGSGTSKITSGSYVETEYNGEYTNTHTYNLVPDSYPNWASVKVSLGMP